MAQISEEQINYIVSRFPCLSDVTIEDWNTEGISLASLSSSVFHEGQFLEFAVLVLDGTIRMYKISGSGREITHYRINGGECCPLMMSSILGETVYEASASIEKPSTFLALPTVVFRDWMDRYKSFRQFIFKMFARRLLIMSNLLDSINFKSIRGRVAEYLVLKTRADNETLVMTHDALSVELGSAREVISRTLKTMEQEGLLRLARGRITEIQRRKLELLIEL